jgi:hypothetical protein
MTAPNLRSTSKWKSIGRPPMAQPVQQRAAEQDRDPRGPGVRVDVRDVRALHLGRVEHQLARLLTRLHGDAVQLEQPAHDAYVSDVGDIAQAARLTAEKGGHHGLGYEVLRTADTDLALERGTAVDKQHIGHVGHSSRVPGDGQKNIGFPADPKT